MTTIALTTVQTPVVVRTLEKATWGLAQPCQWSTLSGQIECPVAICKSPNMALPIRTPCRTLLDVADRWSIACSGWEYRRRASMNPISLPTRMHGSISILKATFLVPNFLAVTQPISTRAKVGTERGRQDRCPQDRSRTVSPSSASMYQRTPRRRDQVGLSVTDQESGLLEALSNNRDFEVLHGHVLQILHGWHSELAGTRRSGRKLC
jgi:hypothetical protein